MPRTELVFYSERGTAPFLAWMDTLGAAVQVKIVARLDLLAERGHELRRPQSDTLRDGIHELRVLSQRVNYRVLYFFHGSRVVISHGCTKEDAVPSREIEIAIRHRARYAADPSGHTYGEAA